MIKKFNALLLVVIGLLVVAKVAVKTGKSLSRAESAEPVVRTEVRNAGFSPTLYYFQIPGLSLESRMTNRNGYLLDVVRAVFPNVRFNGALASVAGLCAESGGKGDELMILPRSVLHDMNFICPDVDLYRQQIVVYTLRCSAWSYAGPASLRSLRLGVREEFCVIPEVKAILGQLGDRVRIYRSGEVGHGYFAQAIQSGEVDGYLIQRQSLKTGGVGEWGQSGDRLMNLRCSPPVCEIPFVLGVSNADPARAKELAEAFEKGYREIEQSGELRRIRSYYDR